MSRKDMLYSLDCPLNHRHTTAHAFPNQRPSSSTLKMVKTHARWSLSPQITDGTEPPTDQTHQPDSTGGRTVYCVKPLRFQGLLDL